jgi:DNA-binding transcriptional regulator LsrR (DeoR family)
VSGGRAFPIYAPLTLDTVESAAGIRRQPQVATAMEMFGQLTKAVVAVGSWNPPNSELQNALEPDERQALVDAGVRAEICAILFDDEGRVLCHDVSDRSISIRAEELRRVPEVIAVAGGESKVRALRAVLLSGFVTTVITDQATARQLIDGVAG